MAPHNDLIALMPKFSSISLNCCKSSTTPDLRSRSTESSNIALRQNTRYITCMNSGDNLGKPNTTSEVTFDVSRDANLYGSEVYNSKFDVRFGREINKYLVKSLGQSSKIKGKLSNYRIEHRRQRLRRTSKQSREKAVNVSPVLSKLELQTIPTINDTKFVQTDITLSDTISQETNNKNRKECDTRENEPKVSVYRTHLQSEIISWLINVPIFYSTDFTSHKLKHNIANTLAVCIEQLSETIQDPKYETKIKNKIDECLNVLPMWLPNTQQERILFKNGLRNTLYEKLKTINDKYLLIQNNDTDNDETNNKLKIDENIDLNLQNDKIYNEINNWFNKIAFTKPVLKRRIVKLIMKRISPLMKVYTRTLSYKLMLKGEIVEILNDLPVKLGIHDKSSHLNRYAEDLVYRLISLQKNLVPIRYANGGPYQKYPNEITVPLHYNLEQTIHAKVNKALENVNVQNKNVIEEEICDTIINSLETLRSGIEISTNNEIYNIIRRTSDVNEKTARNIANKIKIYLKIALKQDQGRRACNVQDVRHNLSGVISIYRSDDPATSTPKKPYKKDIPRLNTEERAYIGQVAVLIRTWMDTLPTSFDDDQNYKDTIINDLAGDIMDEVKRVQLSPDTNTEKDKQLKYFMYRWLVRFGVFDDLHDSKPAVTDFLNKLKQIPEPKLTAPQYGTRQAMSNIKLAEDELNRDEDFVPKGIDILEDQISVWMNDQPTQIYNKHNKKNHEKLVKSLALKIQDHLRNKSPENEIENDIKNWLSKILNENEKEHLGLLIQNLKEKLINVPQDETLESRNIKRRKDMAEYRQQAGTSCRDNTCTEIEPEDTTQDPDNTMKEFILKYMDHNYDIDDPMARRALGELLIIELRKLLPLTRREVYDNFEKKTTHEKFRPEKLNNVLEYIKIISDWLKNIPIHPLYNTPGHRPRVDFVNDLARNIQEVEDQRKENPCGLDYDLYISSVISESIRNYNIPVLPEHKNNIPLMVDQLLSKIIINRSIMDQNNSSTISDIKEQSLSEFIEDYIRINGIEIAEDEVKLEAWTAWLLEEVKKIISDGADPKTCKGRICERFLKFQIPVEVSVKHFSSEISYIKEISDWLKNFPLLPISGMPEAEEERVHMITNLALNIAARDAKISANPKNTSANTELQKYITDWISKLPLNPHKSIVVPILIQQLMNRIDKVNNKPDIISINKPMCCPKTTNTEKDTNIENDPGTDIVEFIENWCNNLPIQGVETSVMKMKSNMAKNLYQKICELNADPKTYDDALLYRDLLEDEIDTQFENIPQDAELQNNKELLKTEFLTTILNLRNVIKKKSAGDDYKHKLETTIDAAIPNPVQNREISEPGFEIYKNHLANMFILDNFDHCNDEVKAKYEKRIRAETNKYFDSAINQNALPMTRDQMYNELYSKLFKVSMPKKGRVTDKVEEIKTRYEIDVWFDDLPIRKTDDLIDLLERDKILTSLAERIHEIEKNKSKPEEEIRKEIDKCLLKLPLQEGAELYMNDFIDKLENSLKTSRETRKCVAIDPEESSKGKTVVEPTTKISVNTSKAPGLSCKCKTEHSLSPPSPSRSKPKTSGDFIVEIVEEWCSLLPLIGNETENKVKKDNLSTKIVMKIYELNADAAINDEDMIFDQLLDEELDKLMADLVGGHDFEQSKPARKHQLILMIKSVAPLIRDEKESHDYKIELNNTVVSILKSQNLDDNKGMMTEKTTKFNKLTDDIVNNFVKYNYNNDDETKQEYKTKVHDAVKELLVTANNKSKVDPLILKNQLLCELSKIPAPNDEILKHIVEETKMKNEVEQLFDETAIDDDTKETAQMKNTLTKRLVDMERLGHTDTNDEKIKTEIVKCLNKLNKTVPPQVIDNFVNSLKNTEADRHSPELRKYNSDENIVYKMESPTIATYRSKSPADDIVSRQISLPCPACQQLVCSQRGQHSEDLDQSHLYQQGISEPTASLLNQDPGNFDNTIYRPDTNQVWSTQPPGQTQYRPETYEEVPAGSFIPLNLSPQGYDAPTYRTDSPVPAGVQPENAPPAYMENRPASIPEYPPAYRDHRRLSATVPPYRVKSPPSLSRENRIQNKSVQRLPCTTQQNINRYQPDNNSRNSYESECQHSYRHPSPDRICSRHQPLGPRSHSMNYPFRAADNAEQTLSYDYFKSGHLLNSTAVPKPDRQPNNSCSRSLDDALQGSRNGQTTPRRVQGEAQSTVSLSSAPHEETPESFGAPNFVPKPLYNPIRLTGREFTGNSPYSGLSSASSLRYFNTTRPVKRRSTDPIIERPREQRYRCVCDKRKRLNNGPCYMMPINQHCDECGGYYPMWCRMPLPGCFYLN